MSTLEECLKGFGQPHHQFLASDTKNSSRYFVYSTTNHRYLDSIDACERFAKDNLIGTDRRWRRFQFNPNPNRSTTSTLTWRHIKHRNKSTVNVLSYKVDPETVQLFGDRKLSISIGKLVDLRLFGDLKGEYGKGPHRGIVLAIKEGVDVVSSDSGDAKGEDDAEDTTSTAKKEFNFRARYRPDKVREVCFCCLFSHFLAVNE